MSQTNGGDRTMADRPEICSSPRTKPFSSRWGATAKFAAKSNAWEENKVVPEGEELVIRVEGGRWFITKHPPPYRLAGAPGADLDLDDISAATADSDGEATVS
jgi:hypothetical protein